MLKRKYYCLTAGLPDLFFNENKPGFGSLDFRNELEYQLESPDFELVKLLFLHIDNENLIHLLFEQNKPFNQHGILPKYFLDPELEPAIELPSYMVQFINTIEKQESKKLSLQVENLLNTLFYEFLLSVKNGFLREWFTFELNIKNILSAINCNHYKYKIEHQIIKTGTESTVLTVLKNAPIKPELLEEHVPFSEQIFRVAESESKAIDKEKAIDKIKWDYLDENTFFHYFTIEKILSYVIKLMITERWMKLDAQTGKELLNKLINELKTSYEFPVEFSILK